MKYTDAWSEDGLSRVCTSCHQWLPIDEFGKRRAGHRGRQSRCRPCVALKQRTARANDPLAREKERAYEGRYYEEIKKRRYSRSYGLSPEHYDLLVELQGGACAVCYTVSKKGLIVDHDHKTGLWRALLCSTCNVAMGLVGDDPARLRALADYLDDNEFADLLARTGGDANARFENTA